MIFEKNNNYNQHHSNNGTLSQDAQNHWRETLLSTTQVLTEQEQSPSQQLLITKKKRKCCHGNRKLQHFKRKCRARGLNQDEIIVLIQKRNHTISEQLPNDQIIHEQTKISNKRKRGAGGAADLSQQDLLNSSMKSMSQLSISQEGGGGGGRLKKMMSCCCSTDETMSSSDNDNSSTQSNYANCTRYNHPNI